MCDDHADMDDLMEEQPDLPSLLPYLASENAGIGLKLTDAAASECVESSPGRFPFRVISDASPLTRVLKADIVTSDGGTLASLFLLLQRDTYRYRPNAFWPLTNPDIEASWQRAYASRPGMPLSAPPGADGRRLPFHPLFFCSYRGHYFHPPCPRCGGPLMLCTDDALLSAQGLSAYQSSLRRYLYCPSCPPEKEGRGFYTHTLEPSDAAGVQDCAGLIVSWRRLLQTGQSRAGGFPCPDCEGREGCHGEGNQSMRRIWPLAFYPFHMQAFRAMHLPGADFLPLLSGAGIGELETQLLDAASPTRLSGFREFKQKYESCERFLFEGTDKHFLEILYLKLALLGDITARLQAAPPPLDIPAAIDSLWVHLPGPGNLLPGLWHFETALMDIGVTGRGAWGLPQAQPASMAYFLGMVWFHTLLAAPHRSGAALLESLAPLLEGKDSPEGIASFEPLFEETDLFSPEHIFWTPPGGSLSLPPVWMDLWKRALAIAWDLASAGRPGHSGGWELEGLEHRLTAICSEIKSELFGETAPTVAETSEAAETRAIYGILTGLLEKPEKGGGTINPDLAETLVLGEVAAKPLSEPAEPPAEAPVEPPAEASAEASAQEPPPEDLEATVLISPGKPEADRPSGPVQPEVEDLPGTVILSGKERRNTPVPPAQPDPPQGPPAPPEPQEEEDLLLETVILRTPPKKDEDADHE
jgi:hypothetical protein